MCRLMVFAGNCPDCHGYFTWNELSQELACLEAKNNGIFGECRKGVHLDQHNFSQECDACLDEAAYDDEGVAGLDDDEEAVPATKNESHGKSKSGSSSSKSSRSSSSKKDDSRKRKKHRSS